jgi:hypothetical protein
MFWRRFKSIILLSIVTLISTTILLLIILYFFYIVYQLPYVQKANSYTIQNHQPVFAEVQRRTYSLSKPYKDRPSLFWNLPPEKLSQDVLRIGAFGDSFTWGYDVEKDQDFPSQLQKILLAQGVKRKIEVVNFGASWHGYGQMYNVWKALSNRYSIDVSLFGPGGLFDERDILFNHTSDIAPAFIHSRFVLEGEGLMEIIPPENEWHRRMTEYYRFFPLWKYLKYDKRPPAFIRGFLKKNTTIENPFYYSTLPSNLEAAMIRSRLVERIRRDDKQTLFGSFIGNEKLYRDNPNLDFLNVQIPWCNTFVLLGAGHCSVFGNYLVANIYSQMLLGESPIQIYSAGVKLDFENLPYVPSEIKMISIEVGKKFQFEPARLKNRWLPEFIDSLAKNSYALVAFGEGKAERFAILNGKSLAIKAITESGMFKESRIAKNLILLRQVSKDSYTVRALKIFGDPNKLIVDFNYEDSDFLFYPRNTEKPGEIFAEKKQSISLNLTTENDEKLVFPIGSFFYEKTPFSIKYQKGFNFLKR